MVKTFHHLPGHAPIEPAPETPSVKTFHHIPPAISTPVSQPRPLFADKAVTSEQTDAAWRERIEALLACCDAADFELSDRDLQRIRILHAEIRFEDLAYQSQYTSEIVTGMHGLQDKLGKLIADPALQRLHVIAAEILQTANRIDIATLDPTSLSSRISDWWRGRDARRQKLQREFEQASQQLGRLIPRARQESQILQQRLQQFGDLFQQNEILFHQLTIHIIAAHLSIEAEDQRSNEQEQALQSRASNDPFAWQALQQRRDAASSWRRKISNLQCLRHTSLLTLPQLRLSQQNLLAMVGRFDDICQIVLPTWKQQFLTALTLAHADESSLFAELSRLQSGLREQLERLT